MPRGMSSGASNFGVSLMPQALRPKPLPPPPLQASVVLCPPPPLQPCPLLSGQPAPADGEPIDYSLKGAGRGGRSRSRSRSRSPVSQKPRSLAQLPDSNLQGRAARAAEIVRVKMEGHGRRVHLFLGIILHSSLRLSGDDVSDEEEVKVLSDVAVFCDESRKPMDRPSQYFLVLHTQLLALIWCKFKSNSSSEFSTLTRAIRSSRQKYRGIFESVATPCKKLYKFGPVAMEEFQRLFPLCYVDT